MMGHLRYPVIAIVTAVCLAGAFPLRAASSDAGGNCVSPAHMLGPMRHFAHRLLVEKDPAGAYAGFAAPDFVQRNPPFGQTIASTIAQWRTMTDRSSSSFHILSIRLRADVADIRFLGQLGPGQTAEVHQHDRLRCGKIVEEWAEFKILTNDPPSPKP